MTRGAQDESSVAQAAAPPQQGKPHSTPPGVPQAAPRGNPYEDHGAPRVSIQGLPGWLDPVVEAVRTVRPTQLSRFLPPEDGRGRQSAVLILFGEGPRGPELLLMERAGSLRSHPGQPSFPGGALDPEDGDPHTAGPLRAALREAEEETGLDPMRRPALRRPAAPVHPGQRVRRDPGARLVARSQPGRRRGPGRDRPRLHGSRGRSHGSRSSGHGSPPERPSGPRFHRRIGSGLGFYRRSDRPAAAFLGMGAPLGPIQASPARLARMRR